MLLTPAHFEELTFRQEDLLQYHSASRPFNWGISHLAVDETQLMQGRFVLLELEALMPDGLPIWIDRNGSSQPALDLESLELSFRQQPFFVYLAAIAHNTNTKIDRDLRYATVADREESHKSSSADQI